MTRIMSRALDLAWDALVTAGHAATTPYRAVSTRNRMARAIIEHAKKGVTDPDRLASFAIGTVLGDRTFPVGQKPRQSGRRQ